MKRKKNGLISLLLSICMFITMAFSAYAAEGQNDEQLQPGWIKVNEYRYENPTTGEYFVIHPNLARASSTSVTFDFKIQYSFDCPTKFNASGTSASVKSSAHVEDSSGAWIGGTSYGYAIYVGSKKASFTTGNSSATKKVSGLRSGSSYTLSASTLNKMGSYYVVGSATVQ
ncbi:hypothetical protein [Clostridium sp. Marseille-P2415]|uniref:hypothetical protein n=1 Tax=Clostridium sp. Marseille-P2415 TaxID=1805471 RepID=UPI000988950D|nr:hypothetical protein [Clostridium sp. Marseille-P2415]